jgi:hypothetical protein
MHHKSWEEYPLSGFFMPTPDGVFSAGTFDPCMFATIEIIIAVYTRITFSWEYNYLLLRIWSVLLCGMTIGAQFKEILT